METQTQQQPQPAQGRKQKNILIPMGGKSQLETNRKLFEWCQKNILEYGDNVYVFNYNSAWRKAASAKEMASPFYAGASDEVRRCRLTDMRHQLDPEVLKLESACVSTS